MASTIVLQDNVKKTFDVFCSEWGKHGESNSDIVERMVNVIQKMNEEIESDSK